MKETPVMLRDLFLVFLFIAWLQSRVGAGNHDEGRHAGDNLNGYHGDTPRWMDLVQRFVQFDNDDTLQRNGLREYVNTMQKLNTMPNKQFAQKRNRLRKRRQASAISRPNTTSPSPTVLNKVVSKIVDMIQRMKYNYRNPTSPKSRPVQQINAQQPPLLPKSTPVLQIHVEQSTELHQPALLQSHSRTPKKTHVQSLQRLQTLSQIPPARIPPAVRRMDLVQRVVRSDDDDKLWRNGLGEYVNTMHRLNTMPNKLFAQKHNQLRKRRQASANSNPNSMSPSPTVINNVVRKIVDMIQRMKSNNRNLTSPKSRPVQQINPQQPPLPPKSTPVLQIHVEKPTALHKPPPPPLLLPQSSMPQKTQVQSLQRAQAQILPARPPPAVPASRPQALPVPATIPAAHSPASLPAHRPLSLPAHRPLSLPAPRHPPLPPPRPPPLPALRPLSLPASQPPSLSVVHPPAPPPLPAPRPLPLPIAHSPSSLPAPRPPPLPAAHSPSSLPLPARRLPPFQAGQALSLPAAHSQPLPAHRPLSLPVPHSPPLPAHRMPPIPSAHTLPLPVPQRPQPLPAQRPPPLPALRPSPLPASHPPSKKKKVPTATLS